MVPGVVEDGVVVVDPVEGGVDPGRQGFATVADVPLGVVLLLVLVPDVVPAVPVVPTVPVEPVVVPLVLHGPATVPVALVPIPVDVVPVWLGVVVVLWLGVVVDMVPRGVDVVPEGVEVVPEGVLVCVELDPVIDGLVVFTEPAFPVVPWVVAEGEVCVAEGEVCVTEGLPLLIAPPGAVV